MANLSEDIQCAGSDTRPPMLDRTDFASWQQRIRLYCRGKENGVNILKSIDEGPFQMGTIRDPIAEGTEGAQQLGPERARVYSDLSPEDKDRYNADIRATNILLQGLPKDIYTLINHYTEAKDIWDNVKMLLEGLELTKEDRESQLYDDFKHFIQNKGETIHDYYVRFAKLINNMRNIKMTMSRMQLNSKFVNNMLPEWGRFVTTVNLNRGATSYEGAQNRVGNANPGQARHIKCCNCNGMDITKLQEKSQKPDKNEHETERVHKSQEFIKQRFIPNIFAPEPSSEASSSRDVSSAESTYVTQTHHHLRKWSKDNPLDNVIGNPSRPVSTRKQLAIDALWCLYNFVLSKVEPKNFKSAITEDSASFKTLAR
ncbi:hypothetical protein Tco_0858317 [Tanacetum coccineum]|uniref:Integrase, catalytic region, zinc finger, CCHC-type, peptidase aspartic, catalytic n=1 Tax=Tanacetum coccineum TaxID=301880 RepID=A0ABQ5B8X5_9ASTR